MAPASLTLAGDSDWMGYTSAMEPVTLSIIALVVVMLLGLFTLFLVRLWLRAMKRLVKILLTLLLLLFGLALTAAGAAWYLSANLPT